MEEITGKQASAAKILLEQTAFAYEKNNAIAIKNIVRLRAITDEIQESLRDEQVLRALEGENGALLKEEDGSFKFSREATKILDVFYRGLMSKTFKFDPMVFPSNKEVEEYRNIFELNNISFLIEKKAD